MAFDIITHGGKRAKRFCWLFSNGSIIIENENGLVHTFDLVEVHGLLVRLHERFGCEWFPLANNVEKMYRGVERPGLGSCIYAESGNTTHAQGASYLGVILDHVGVLEWNGKARGIEWRLKDGLPPRSQLTAAISKP